MLVTHGSKRVNGEEWGGRVEMGYLFSGEYFNMFSIFEYKYLSKHMDR